MRATALLLPFLSTLGFAQERAIRVGMIGLDTSHVVAFTKLLNDPAAKGDLRDVRVVAGYPGGTDIPASKNRVAKFTEQLRGMGVEIVDSIPALLERVDCVMLESVDGRAHLTQVTPVFAAGKPVFIDKPLAGSLRDALRIAALGEEHGVPWFSSSSLRFGATAPDVGEVRKCESWGPGKYDPTVPDLYWYGVHGVEALFTIMGQGCVAVSRQQTAEKDIVTGRWKDGRTGIYRGDRRGKGGYGARLFGTRGTADRGKYRGYAGLVREIAKFFKTGKPPVAPAETIEMFAFMTAAEESKRRGGALVTVAEVMKRARAPQPSRPSILFCIADDWSWPHAGAYGDKVVKTPAFDRIAREGVLFTNGYTAEPSCTPSRAGILTGQEVFRLREGANLHGFLPQRFAVYPDLLEGAGYVVGHQGKGWAPGRVRRGGRGRNPAGPRFKSFAAFLETVSEDEPFCFWFGSHDPHRGYEKGSGIASGMDPAAVEVPPFLPDTPAVRSDICDYYFEVQRFDRDVGKLLDALERAGRLDDTLVVMTSDNGMPFPRAKANVYDAGVRMPLAVMWRRRLRGGHTTPAFTSFVDLAPTFLEAAGVAVPEAMTGESLLPLLFTGILGGRRRVFLARERHAHVRAGNLGYPVRALRNERWLYVRNLAADRWPAGDPELVYSVGAYGDVDNSPSKSAILADPQGRHFDLAFAKRPAEELYDLRADPWQLRNEAGNPALAATLEGLRAELLAWQRERRDPRANAAETDPFDGLPYFGRPARKRRR